MNIFDYIFPKYCLLCSKIGEEICDRCLKEIPYTLPSCCICNKLSNGYLTHKDCSKIQFQCFTGLYISNDLRNALEKKMNLGIYTTHIYLLEKIVERLSLSTIIHNSQIYQIQDIKNEINILNSQLANSLRITEEKKDDILLVGNCIGNKEMLLQQVKGLYKEPFNLRILVLFEQSTAPKFLHPLE